MKVGRMGIEKYCACHKVRAPHVNLGSSLVGASNKGGVGKTK